MTAFISPTETYYPGQGFYLESDCPQGRYQVAFEENWEAAWFHLIDTRIDTKVDADKPQHSLWLYQPQNDAELFCEPDGTGLINIIWSSDGKRVGLFINNRGLALFDIEHRYAFCHEPIPSTAQSRWQQHPWDDRLLSLL
jgi:hypothetical protein